MKNIIKITTLFILSLSLTIVHGQWLESNGFTTVSLYEVAYPDLSAAYIITDFGGVLKSTNQGVTWNEIYNFGPFSSIHNLHFIDANIGFINIFSSVYRTLDGGDSWEDITWYEGNSTNSYLIKIKSINQRIYTSYTVGDTTFFSQSANYGDSWNTLFYQVSDNAQIFRFSMIDSLNGYFVNPNELEQILKTTDGGVSFSDTLTVVTGPLTLQNKFDYADVQHGFNYGNSGGNWSSPSRTSNSTQFYSLDFDGFGVLPVLDLDLSTSKIYGASLYGKIFVSYNGGVLWTEQTCPIDGPVRGIAFADENHGIAIVGTEIVYTNNGGALAIDELPLTDYNIQAFPIPASDFITIKVGDNVKLIKTKLVDINGNLLKTFYPWKRKLNIADVVSGSYFLNFETRDGIISRKILIQR